MTATHRTRAWVAVVAFALLLVVDSTDRASAGTWPVAATASTAAAQSVDPQPPAGVASACTTGSESRTVTVTWSAVSYATSYVVYQSTTSSTAGFSVVASGVTGTSWTTAALKKGTYWYTVATVAGSATWTSPMSAPSDARTIATNPRCG